MGLFNLLEDSGKFDDFFSTVKTPYGIAPEEDNSFLIGGLGAPEPVASPVIQETVIVESEVNDISEALAFNNSGQPVDTPNVVFVSSPELTGETDNDIPVGPPVFFPTLLPDFIKTGDPLAVTAQAVPASSQLVSTARDSGGFSNIDLGLAALGVVAIGATALIAIFRK